MPGSNGRLETADTCCAGSNCVVLEFTNHVVDVNPYHKDLGKMTLVPIALVAMLVTDKNGEECIFVVNEALWFGPAMENSLISSNQVRAYGVQLWDNPCDPDHNLFIHNMTTDHIIPLEMDGIVACAETRVPTNDEILGLPHVHITSDVPWHLKNALYRIQTMEVGRVTVQRNVSFAETTKESTESSSLFPSVTNPGVSGEMDPDLWQAPDFSVIHNQRFDSGFPYSDINTPDLTFTNISAVYSSSFADEVTSVYPHPQGLATLLRTGGFSVKAQTRSQAMLAPAVADAVDELVRATCSIEYHPNDFSKHRHCQMKCEDLEKKWHISKKSAEKTMQHTCQEGTRNAPMPLARQYPTGHDRNHFNHLDGKWYTDVFFNSVASTGGYSCALLVYSGKFCWTQCLTTKADVDKAIELFCY